MRRLHRNDELAPSWIPGAWVLVGAELLVALWFDGLGPPRFDRYLPFHFLSRSEAMFDLARGIALVHLLAIVSLWLYAGRLPQEDLRARGRRIACLATALSLALTPVLFVELAHQTVPPETYEVRGVWELDDEDQYVEWKRKLSTRRP